MIIKLAIFVPHRWEYLLQLIKSCSNYITQNQTLVFIYQLFISLDTCDLESAHTSILPSRSRIQKSRTNAIPNWHIQAKRHLGIKISTKICIYNQQVSYHVRKYMVNSICTSESRICFFSRPSLMHETELALNLIGDDPGDCHYTITRIHYKVDV